MKSLKQEARNSVNASITAKTLDACASEITVTMSPGTAPELTQTPVDKFRTSTFLVIVDNVDTEFKKRLEAYTGIAARFGSLRKLKNLPCR